jgi:hypothetical protein
MVYFQKFGMNKVVWLVSVIIIVVFLIGLTASGCGKAPVTSTATTTKTAAVTSSTTTKTTTSSSTKTSVSTPTVITTTSTTTTKTSTPTKTISNDPFTRLDDTLEDMDVYFQKTWMAAESIGAKEGYKYATYSGTFELYLYDIGSDAYKTAVKNNAMSLGDTLFPAIIKDGFALYFYDNAKEELRTKIKGILFQ